MLRVGLDIEDVFPVIASNLADMRGIGVERVFDQLNLKVAITLI
jgi:hypothetical protein